MSRKFNSKRANDGIDRRLLEEIQAAPPNASVSWEYAADWALSRYDKRVRAVLRDLGLDVPDTGAVTVQDILQAVNTRTGLELTELTPQAIMSAFDAQLAAQLSQRLGFTVSTALNPVQMRSEVKAQLLGMLAQGRGGGLVKGETLESLKQAATFARAGLSANEGKAALNRWYQRKYAKSHQRVWR